MDAGGVLKMGSKPGLHFSGRHLAPPSIFCRMLFYAATPRFAGRARVGRSTAAAHPFLLEYVERLIGQNNRIGENKNAMLRRKLPARASRFTRRV